MNSKTMVIALAAVILVGTAAFFAGMQVGRKNMGARRFQQFRSVIEQGNIGHNGSVPVRGQIINAGSGSITVKLPDGTSKIIVLSGNTAITKSASGSASDLKDGLGVVVVGNNNSDGSVTAETIQIYPFKIGTFPGASK